ncbi:hypothetical protein B7494_g1437 [Chlorociboria aeruginascens]|nr:hypothetical protein B7494_g1437 [Chlorociboria aeruginascens]
MTAESRHDQDSSSTALRGASLAFKPPIKPKPKINTYSGNNGALAAAKKAEGGSTISAKLEPSSAGYQRTGDNVGTDYFDRSRIGLLQLPGTPDLSKSPSLIAATLATSRSIPNSPNNTGQQRNFSTTRNGKSTYTRPSPGSIRSLSPVRSDSDQGLDTTPIPPTTSLIGMFERNTEQAKVALRPGIKRANNAPFTNQQPKRQISPLPPRAQSPPSLFHDAQKSEFRPLLAQPAPTKPAFVPPQKPILPTRKPLSHVTPIAIPSKSKSPETEVDDNTSSDDSFVSASSYKPSFRAELQRRQLRSTSVASINSSVTIDSLANAIVASSLASSRAASPSKSSYPSTTSTLYPPPRPPSRRRFFHNNSKDVSRTPSPSKQGISLRTTMRKPKTDDEIDEGEKRRGKKNLVKKHPNKHHEGDRKRWRDEITERERKRYEAVWASNKGLYSATPNPIGGPSYNDGNIDSTICNLIARDIFVRSRLHVDVLEEVYELVDRHQNQRLEREEFVVALWLIDQRLKGRKLPIRVSDSVWRSVGVLRGIKIKKAHR